MRFLGIVVFAWVSFIASQAFAVDKCRDFSHVRVYPGVPGEFVFTQDGCSGWSVVQIVDGEPVAEPVRTEFKSEWRVTKVEDEYETYEGKQRWYFGEFGDLNHEYQYRGLNKQTSVETRKLAVENFSLRNGAVHRSGGEYMVETAADGTETTKSKKYNDDFSRK